MKKIIVFLSVVFMAVSAKADIAIYWSSDTWFSPYGITHGPASTPAEFIPANAYHVLIWSLTAPPTGNYALAGTGLGAGEVALWDSNKTLRAGDVRSGDPYGAGAFNYGPGGVIIFTDGEAPGGDANAGYVYSRIFSYNTVSAGDWYYQSEVYNSPSLPDYLADPPQTFSHTTCQYNEITGDRTMGTGPGMYQVIPEPGTLLLALPAIGLVWFRRRTMCD